ncbi:MAG: sigma-54-dependent Fis family transcriptional regulator [Bacteroidales bacterium]|nr:sigma-54-dependent Fis family transcriptional regulator [Bacteroidales bacterium]
MSKKGKLLIVDDNTNILSAVKMLTENYFEKVITLDSPKSLISTIQTESPDVILLDMNFHAGINTGNEGIFWLNEVNNKFPKIKVVLFTAYADIDLAVRAMKDGAYDFIVKPWNNEKLIETLQNAYNEGREKKKPSKPNDTANESQMFWGNSPKMLRIKNIVERVSATDANIMITGENGTGKEVLAREIHRLSSRRNNEMISLDMGAIPETLFESELFGHKKGAFTDAHSDRMGKMEAANNSTLFMDEIGNMPLHLQAKLLTALQNRNITRLGTNNPINIDIRLITATNRNLFEMAEKAEFRQDLLFRINTIHINIPPLRNRKEDIIPLAEMFLKRYSEKYKKDNVIISAAAEEKMLSHRWDGNIRELQHTIEKAVIMCDDNVINPEHLGLYQSVSSSSSSDNGSTLEDVERRTIAEAINSNNGNLSLVAQKLGITRQTLYNKIKRYGL